MNSRIFIALALALTCNLSFSATLEGCVVRVADGDTELLNSITEKENGFASRALMLRSRAKPTDVSPVKTSLIFSKHTVIALLWNMNGETTMTALSVKSSPAELISIFSKLNLALHGFTATILKTSLWTIKPATLQPKFQPEIVMQGFGLILIQLLRGCTGKAKGKFVPRKIPRVCFAAHFPAQFLLRQQILETIRFFNSC